MPEDAVITLTLDTELRDRFVAEAEQRAAPELLRELGATTWRGGARRASMTPGSARAAVEMGDHIHAAVRRRIEAQAVVIVRLMHGKQRWPRTL